MKKVLEKERTKIAPQLTYFKKLKASRKFPDYLFEGIDLAFDSASENEVRVYLFRIYTLPTP